MHQDHAGHGFSKFAQVKPHGGEYFRSACANNTLSLRPIVRPEKGSIRDTHRH